MGGVSFSLAALTPDHLVGVLSVQARAYGDALLEAPDVLRSKLRVPGETCWGAFLAGAPDTPLPLPEQRLCAYAIAHAQAPDAPLALNKVLHERAAPTAADWLYVHDIAVDPDCAGQRLAERLLTQVLARARQHALTRAMLVAVQGAEAYWARHGFAARPAPMPVLGFGADAVWMARAL